MDGQMIAVIAIVAAAGLYMVRRVWRTWAGKKSGCASSCSCAVETAANKPALIPSEDLTNL